MRHEDNLMTCTVLGLARYIRDNIVTNEDGDFTSFPECNFCIIDSDDEAYALTDLRSKAEDWYGIKVVNGGFNSICLVVMSDYYGGGYANIAQIYNDGFAPAEGTVQDLEKMIEATLCEREFASYNTLLLVEFPKKNFVAWLSALQYGMVEVCADNEEAAEEAAMEIYNSSSNVCQSSIPYWKSKDVCQSSKVYWHSGEITDITIQEKKQ